MTVTVRPLEVGDRARWQQLYAGYGEFYGKPLDDAKANLVWGWVLDDAHESEAIVAEHEGRVVAIAHFREFARPLSGGRAMYLDDLFTDPGARGLGAATALLGKLKSIARERGLVMVRWITAADNVTAQRIYDELATRTRWVTYDMEV